MTWYNDIKQFYCVKCKRQMAFNLHYKLTKLYRKKQFIRTDQSISNILFTDKSKPTIKLSLDNFPVTQISASPKHIFVPFIICYQRV